MVTRCRSQDPTRATDREGRKGQGAGGGEFRRRSAAQQLLPLLRRARQPRRLRHTWLRCNLRTCLGVTQQQLWVQEVASLLSAGYDA